jgi:hypothetical protein
MDRYTEEAVRLIDALLEEKARVLLEFARFLAEKNDEEEWERKFSEPRYRPKLFAVMNEVEEENASGQTMPLDFERP